MSGIVGQMLHRDWPPPGRARRMARSVWRVLLLLISPLRRHNFVVDQELSVIHSKRKGGFWSVVICSRCGECHDYPTFSRFAFHALFVRLGCRGYKP